MLVVILSIALGTLGDVDQAMVLYDAALYQSALDTLPGDCGALDGDAQRCFRVKGLCEVALNQKSQALRSWTNMCLLELAAAPPPLAPTSVDLWNRACERARWLSRFRLDELGTQNDRAKLVLKRPGGPGERLAEIRFWLKTPVDLGFESFVLTRVGTLWSSSEAVPVVPGPYQYFLDFKLMSGEAYRSGSPEQAYRGKAIEHFETHQFSALTNPWPDRTSKQDDVLIPDWGWWAIAGGVVIVLTTSVAIALSGS